MQALPEHTHNLERNIPIKGYSLGVERYDREPLHEWAVAQAEALHPKTDTLKPLVIDVGGASGFKAMAFAERGCDVKIIDLIGEHDTVDLRNTILARSHSGAGRIKVHSADIRDLEKQDLAEICDGRTPDIVTAFWMPHFLNDKELRNFFNLFAGTSSDSTLLCISYHHPSRIMNRDSTIIFHKPNKVTRTAMKVGYEHISPDLPHYGISYGTTRQAFRLNRGAHRNFLSPANG